MTDKLSGYSTTPANNNAASPDGWPEGMTAGSVNNATREYAARVREWYEDPMWIDYGHTIVSSTSSSIKVSGDQTGVYVANRPIRVNQSGSQVGYITASAYSAPDTSITVSGFTVSSPTQVEAGAISNVNQLPANLSITTSVVIATTANITTASITTANIATASITSMNLVGTLSTGAITGNVVATQAQMEAGTSTNTVVTPGTMQYHPLMPKAWAIVNGSSLVTGHNIASIGVTGSALGADFVGAASITMSSSLTNTNYGVFATQIGTTSATQCLYRISPTNSKVFIIYSEDASGTRVNSKYMVAVYGDLP